ncbi:MAG: hypothetical protein K5842_03920 [Bacteroidales bacterium]|nr:hypothetical protein [Bacteroidales bacterium]
MNVKIKIAVICLLLGTMVVGCQKDNVFESTDVVTQNGTVRTVIYSINGEERQITLVGESTWSEFLHHLIAMSEEGYRVSFRLSSRTSSVSVAKETVTYDTKNHDEAYEWCGAMVDLGYEVSIRYDEQTGVYHCVAVK